MSYPPGSPGYPPAQQPTTQFAAPTQQFNKPQEAPAGAPADSKLPFYLSIAVAALGVLTFLVNFGPSFEVAGTESPIGVIGGGSSGLGLPVIIALLGGLLAGVTLLPKQRDYSAAAAISSVIAFLLVIQALVGKPEGVSIGWALYVIILFTLFQALAAVAVVLFASGVISAPAPKPRYDQPQQGYGGQYGGPGGPGGYGGYPGQGQHPGQQQRGGYPGQGQYGGYPGGPQTGGFSSIPQGGQGGQGGGPANSGPATPPTGFPTYGQPPSSSAQTAQAPVQPSSQPQSGSGSGSTSS